MAHSVAKVITDAHCLSPCLACSIKSRQSDGTTAVHLIFALALVDFPTFLTRITLDLKLPFRLSSNITAIIENSYVVGNLGLIKSN